VSGRNKEVKQFISELEAKGWVIVRKTGTGHIKMRSPCGSTTIFPSSPSDNRWLKNKRCEIKRIERGMKQ